MDDRSKEQVLLKALKYLARHYVGQLENARDRIVSLGGQCDPVDVMERGDPHLLRVREVIASVEATPSETTTDAEDAAKWRALRNCARITSNGSAGLHVPEALARPDAHVTLNFWTHNERETETYPREWLDQFVSKVQRLAEKTSTERPAVPQQGE